MPTNVWHHRLFLTDIRQAMADPDADVERWRDELLRRIRAAPWCDEAGDVVLRYVLGEIEKAVTREQFAEDVDLFAGWADKEENRVWLETTFTLTAYFDHLKKRGIVMHHEDFARVGHDIMYLTPSDDAAPGETKWDETRLEVTFVNELRVEARDPAGFTYKFGEGPGTVQHESLDMIKPAP